MDVREKLIDILLQKPNKCTFEQLADFLIAHGVTVQDNTEISDELLERLRKAPVTVMTEEPTVEVVQEWISVKDRLPDESGMYIVVAKDGHAQRITFVIWQKRNKVWNLTGARSYWKVTHWMPLPDPPKGE